MDYETALVGKAQRGESDALGSLFDLHAETVYAIALGYVPCSADARDLVQDIFIKAFDSLSSLRDPSRFRPWLFRIARTTCLDHQEKVSQTVVTDPTVLEKVVAEESGKGLGTGDESAETLGNRRARVADVLRVLPDEHRVVLTLRYLEGMNYDQIAATLETERAEVNNRLIRAKRYVRKHLGHLSSD